MDSDFSYSQHTQTQTQTQGTQPQSQLSASGFPSHLWGKLVPCSSSTSTSTSELAPPFGGRPSHGSDARLEAIELPWSHLELKIGRHPSCGLKLTNVKVSTWHARIWYDEEEKNVKLMDTSTNGTYVRDRRVGKGNVTVIDNGDVIVFGPASLDFVNDYRYVFRGPAQLNGPSRSGRPWAIDESKGPGIYGSYEVREQIGKGSFAIVWKGLQKATGKTVAIKVIEKARFMSNPKTMQMLAREVEIMKTLRHKYCVQCYDHFEDDHRIWIVLEYIDGGDLLEYVMKNPGGLTVQETREIALMVCEAVAYLHSREITHRDLKPENLLLTKGVKPVCKVTDFGLAKMVNDGTMLRTMCGTPTYLAPEVVLGNDPEVGYSAAVDAWSIGVILYSCLTCQTPFDESESTPLQQRMQERLVDWDWLTMERCLDSVAIDFLSKLLVQDPRKRMSVKEALQHDWLRTIPAHGSQSIEPPREPSQLHNSNSNGSSVASSAALVDKHSPSSASLGLAGNMPNSFVDSQGMGNLRITGTGTGTGQPQTKDEHTSSNNDDGEGEATTEAGDRSMTTSDANDETTIEANLNESTIVPRAPPAPVAMGQAPVSPSISQKRKEPASAWSSSSEDNLSGGGSSWMSLDVHDSLHHVVKPKGEAPVSDLPVVPETKELELRDETMSLASSEIGEEHDAEDESKAPKVETRRSTRRSSRGVSTTPKRRGTKTGGGRRSSTTSSSRASVEPASPDVSTSVEGVMTRRRAKMAKVA